MPRTKKRGRKKHREHKPDSSGKPESHSGDPPAKKRRLRSNTDAESLPASWPEYIESDHEEINLADSDLDTSDSESSSNSPQNTPSAQLPLTAVEGTTSESVTIHDDPEVKSEAGTDEDVFVVEDMSPTDNRWLGGNSDDEDEQDSEDVEIHAAEEDDETHNFVCDECDSLIFDLRWSCCDCQNRYDLCDLCYNQQLLHDPEAEHKEDHVMKAYEVADPELFEDDDNDSEGDKNTEEFFYSDDDSSEEEGEEQASFEDRSFLAEFSQPESIRDLPWDQRFSYLLEEAVQDQGIQATAFLISQFNTVFSGRLFMDDLRSFLFSQPGKAHLEPLLESIICLPGGGPSNTSRFQIVGPDCDIVMTCNYLADGRQQIDFQPPTVTISTDEGCQELLRVADLPELPAADITWLINTLFSYVPSYLRVDQPTEDED